MRDTESSHCTHIVYNYNCVHTLHLDSVAWELLPVRCATVLSAGIGNDCGVIANAGLSSP